MSKQLMGSLLEILATNGEITPEDVTKAESMAKYAVLDASNVVQQVVLWDGVSQWAPPPGQTAVAIPDDLFVEPRGTLNPVTLAFVRAAPPVIDPNSPVVVKQQLLSKGPQALAANKTFLALPSPTNAQSLAQIQSLTKQMNGLIRLVMDKLDSTEDT